MYRLALPASQLTSKWCPLPSFTK